MHATRTSYSYTTPTLDWEDPDSIDRLELQSRTRNALFRAGIKTVSQAIDALDAVDDDGNPYRPPVRNMGPAGWTDLAEALQRPMLKKSLVDLYLKKGKK